MGHKKRTPSEKPRPSAPSTVSDSSPKSPTTAAAADDDRRLQLSSRPDPKSRSDAAAQAATDAVKAECERALMALRRGNHTKALRIMKETCGKYDSCALLHRVHGTVFVKVSSLIDDPNAKQRHVRNAIESARKAVSLSPESVEFAHFYANLLYESANDSKAYEEVIQECERALSVENPVDPAKESLQDEKQLKIPTAEARIAHVQQELRGLVQKSNIASLSSWVKTINGAAGGEEKYRIIPLHRPLEDPMEVRLVQATRRPNEIKKATKTPEERRKEIEVRVAAARLLQQQSPGSLQNHQSQQEEESTRTPSPPSSSGAQRLVERRKMMNVRKLMSSAERMEQARTYWNSMGAEKKHMFLEVRVDDLRSHYLSLKDNAALELLSESLSYADAHGTWKFWVCFRCGEKFSDANSHLSHMEHEHMDRLAAKLQTVLPLEVDREWVDMLLNGSWKPIDILDAEIMLEAEELKRKYENTFVESDSVSKVTESLSDCWSLKDSSCSSDTTPQVESKADGCGKEFSQERRENCETPGLRESRINSFTWPLSVDTDRAHLLQRIHGSFQLLLKHKCLSVSHLNKVLQYTTDELQALPFGSRLVNLGIGRSPHCICFLGASQLRKVNKFLQELCQSCSLGRYNEKNGLSDGSHDANQENEYAEKIVLSADSSCLLLDTRMFTNKNIVENNSSNYDSEDGKETVDGSTLISWLFSGSTSAEQLASWTSLREQKSQQGMEYFQMLDKEFYLLQNMCERKSEHLSYEEALLTVEKLCLEELRKRDLGAKFITQSYVVVLRKRHEELAETENELMPVTNRFELDAISNVLKEAQTLNVNQFGFDETVSSVTSRLCDLECGDEEDWRMQEYLHQADTCVDVAIQRQKEQLTVELSKIDARILRNLAVIQQLEQKLGPYSAFDYRGVVLPLVRSFLRAQLEDLIDRDAEEKSEAAKEAFLAELARDAKKNGKGNDHSKQPQEKSKDRKKSKDHRKAKDMKSSLTHGCNGHADSYNEMVSTSNEDGENESQMILPDDYLKLKQEEEELRQKIELEAEERKLQETLEYQRMIENAAKKRLLEVHSKKSMHSSSQNAADESYLTGLDAYAKPSEDDIKYPQISNNDFSLPEKGLNFGDLCFMETDVLDASQNSEACSSNKFGGLHMLLDHDPGATQKKSHGVFNNKNVPTVGNWLQSDLEATDTSGIVTGQRVNTNSNHINSRYKQERITATRQSTKRRTAQAEGADKSSPGENGVNRWSQLTVEDDEDEKFQADLQKAVNQSLDTMQFKVVPVDRLLTSCNGYDNSVVNISDGPLTGIAKLGAGLKNEAGEYNCFLNVIIQSLWHLRLFRDEFLASSAMHIHIGTPCVICALYDIFNALSEAHRDGKKEPVAPTSLRSALSNLYPDSNFFQEAQMNDASEVLAVIFDCLHKSFTSSSVERYSKLHERNCRGSWDCANSTCVAHRIFGMDVYEKMSCQSCGVESRHLKYTSFFHNINANALRTMKITCEDSSFDHLLRLVEMNHQLACNPEEKGCGKQNYIHHILSAPPLVFTTVLGWQNTHESAEDISKTLSALSTEVDIGIFYRGMDQGGKHSLMSVVCYYGQHYHCFAYSHEHGEWIMYDDNMVKKIGGWEDVVSMCERGHLQPQVLFFEAAN